jgi:hypothetical protein
MIDKRDFVEKKFIFSENDGSIIYTYSSFIPNDVIENRDYY